jgi:protein tyrosine/serine phosphatase
VESATPARPANWAVAIEGKKGLPNFFKVSEVLYRSAQPEEEGFAELKAMGIKTVVDLRTLHSDEEECRKTGLGYASVPMKAWEGENDKDVVEFLKIVSDPNRQPVLVHCQHGADRTGTACAVYRIAVEGWSKEDAIKEMTEGGYGFHSMWDNLIKYVREMDIDVIKKRAGI